MYKFLIFLCLFSFSLYAYAGPGDTIRVQSHQQTHLNWYGSFEHTTIFPSDTQSFYKVLLRFTLGCLTSGCSEWDYTTQVFAQKPTNTFDSTLMLIPSFLVGHSSYSSYSFSTQPTFYTTWNNILSHPDTTFYQPDSIFIFSNGLAPTISTDTLLAWPCQYYYNLFDGSGNIVDSVLVGCDSTLINNPWQVYNVYEIIESYEIARLITPYNGNVPNSWKWTYTYDVTDYVSLLHDTVDIRIFYSGYQDGFTADLVFEFIEGVPPHNAFQVDKLWQGSFPYGSASDPIENHLNPQSRIVPAQTDHAKFRFVPTGHGFGGNENCAEFCPKSYYLFLDNVQRGQNLIWRATCGLNPLFPQAGTWIYDRANWCPGASVQVFDHDITQYITPGTSCLIDVNMQPFNNVNNNNCSYIMEGQVFYYTPITRSLDAEMLEIIAPSNDKNHRRENPICDNAIVVIRNTGSQPLTSATIEYGVVGGMMQTHTWTGNLSFMQTDTVILGNMLDWTNASGEKKFRAGIQQINGSPDSFILNNVQESAYEIPPMYPDTIVIYFKSNSYPNENTYRLFDAQGNVILSRFGMAANTIYRDTIALTPGCYTLELLDSDGDGISFWANSDGNGAFRIQKINPQGTLKTFNGDFGSSIVHHFTTGFYVGIDESTTFTADIFPNPTSGTLHIYYDAQNTLVNGWCITHITGQQVMQGQLSANDGNQHTIQLHGMASGLYILQLTHSGQVVYTSKFILQSE